MKLNEVDTKAGLDQAFQIAKDNTQSDAQEINYLEDHGTEYTAAVLYLKAESGVRKPQLAQELVDITGIDYDVAVLMIDAIDAYEDLKGNI